MPLQTGFGPRGFPLSRTRLFRIKCAAVPAERTIHAAHLEKHFSLPYNGIDGASAPPMHCSFNDCKEDVMNLTRRSSAPLSGWRPSSVEDQFGRLVQEMLQDFVAPFGGGAGLSEQDAISPRLTVSENDKAYEVDAEMPGVKKEDIKVSIDHERVTIEAECRRANEQRQGQNVVYSESKARKFLRSFMLPTEVDDAAAQAKLEDGILHLTLPKKQGAEAHRLSIQ
jgi:HSP20 family protein